MHNRDNPIKVSQFSDRNILDLLGKPITIFDENCNNSDHPTTTTRITCLPVIHRNPSFRLNSIDYDKVLSSLQDPEELEIKKHEK